MAGGTREPVTPSEAGTRRTRVVRTYDADGLEPDDPYERRYDRVGFRPAASGASAAPVKFSLNGAACVKR